MRLIALLAILFSPSIALANDSDLLRINGVGKYGSVSIQKSSITTYPGLVAFTIQSQPANKKATFLDQVVMLCGSGEVYKVSFGLLVGKDLIEPFHNLDTAGRDAEYENPKLTSVIKKSCYGRPSTKSLAVPISRSKFKESEQYGAYVLPAQTRIESPYVSMWVASYRLAVSKKSTEKGEYEELSIDKSKGYNVSQTVYNCTDKTSRDLKDIRYGAGGNVEWDFDFKDTVFKPIIPNSVGETQFNFACGMI